MAKQKNPAIHLNSLRRQFPAGLSIEEMQGILHRDYNDPVSVPTIRKYVQSGFMERSTRRGLSDGCGSKGYYPVTALVQLVRVREQLKTSSLAATVARGTIGIHRHIDAIRESLESALSGLITLSRQERRAASVKPDLVRLRATMTAALDELGDIAEAGNEERAP